MENNDPDGWQIFPLNNKTLKNEIETHPEGEAICIASSSQ